MVATFITTQRKNVETFSTDVTSEQIGKCMKVYDYNVKAWVYFVENESGKLNDNNELVEYKVQWSKERGFTCSCPSGQAGFLNVKHPSGVCKHVRWSAAAAREEHAATTTTVTNSLIIDGRPATQEEYERIMNAPVKPVYKAHVIQPRAFKII